MLCCESWLWPLCRLRANHANSILPCTTSVSRFRKFRHTSTLTSLIEIICTCFQEDPTAHQELSTLYISLVHFFRRRRRRHANSKIKTELHYIEFATWIGCARPRKLIMGRACVLWPVHRPEQLRRDISLLRDMWYLCLRQKPIHTSYKMRGAFGRVRG